MLLQAKQQAQGFFKFVGLIEHTEIQMHLEINHMLDRHLLLNTSHTDKDMLINWPGKEGDALIDFQKFYSISEETNILYQCCPQNLKCRVKWKWVHLDWTGFRTVTEESTVLNQTDKCVENSIGFVNEWLANCSVLHQSTPVQ